MVLARIVFHAKFGKAGDLVKAFKEMSHSMTDEQIEAIKPRVLTDISGRFDTVILETTHESLAALEQFRIATFAQAEADEEPSPMEAFIETGRNEYYTIEM